MTKKNLPQGVKHPHLRAKKFVAAEVDDATHARFKAEARRCNRSVSGQIRYLMENADLILSEGVKHLSEKTKGDKE